MHAQYDLLSALAMYVRFFNEDQQPQLVQRLDNELRRVISRPMKRSDYKDYTTRLITLRNTCPAGKTLADTLVAHCRQTYCNRPAMLDELKRYAN